MQHYITPDMPPAIVAALSEYDWNRVHPSDIEKMMQFMEQRLQELPAKPAGWMWQGVTPKFELTRDVPQAAFNRLNTRDWGKVAASTVQEIISGARMYFALQGVPKKPRA